MELVKNEKIAFSHYIFEVTRRCNFSCEHCLRGDAQNIDLSYNAIDNLLDQTLAMGDILFTGGEPLLALDRIEYIIDGMIKRKIPFSSISIISNGTQYNEDFYRVIHKIYDYLFSMHTKLFGDKIKFPKRNIALLISDDDFHKKFIPDTSDIMNQLRENLGDIAYIAYHNAGMTPVLKGRGKQLKCGAYSVKNKPCKIELYGKDRKCFCSALSYGLGGQDYITVCCDMYMTAKGYMIKMLEGEFADEDKEDYIIADLNINECVLDGIDRFNEKYPCLCLFTQKELESERDKMNHKNVEAIYRKIQTIYKALKNNKDEISKYKDDEEDEENWKDYVYEICTQTGKTKEEKDFLYNISLLPRDEKFIIKDYTDNKEELYLAFPYLTKEQRDYIEENNKNNRQEKNRDYIILNFEKKSEDIVQMEYDKSTTIEMVEAADKFYWNDLGGNPTEEDFKLFYSVMMLKIFETMDLPKDTSDSNNINLNDTEESPLYTQEEFMYLLDNFHKGNIEKVNNMLERERFLRMFCELSKFGYNAEKYTPTNIFDEDFNLKMFKYYGGYNYFMREIKKYQKDNIVPDDYKEILESSISELNRLHDWYKNINEHPFLYSFTQGIIQGLNQYFNDKR